MLPLSLDCTFVIVPSIFSNTYSRDRQFLISAKNRFPLFIISESDSVSECSTNNASLYYIFQWPIMQNRVKNRTLSEKKRNPTALQDTVPTEHAIAIVDIQIVNT